MDDVKVKKYTSHLGIVHLCSTTRRRKEFVHPRTRINTRTYTYKHTHTHTSRPHLLANFRVLSRKIFLFPL